MGYDFEIKYNLGTKNQTADAISHHQSFSHLVLYALLSQCSISWEEVQSQIAADPFLHTLQNVSQGVCNYPGYTINQGLLLYKD